MLKSLLLILFIAFLFVCAFLESIRSQLVNGFIVFPVALGVYIGTMLPVWFSLLIFLYRGKLYRNFVYKFSPHKPSHRYTGAKREPVRQFPARPDFESTTPPSPFPEADVPPADRFTMRIPPSGGYEGGRTTSDSIFETFSAPQNVNNPHKRFGGRMHFGRRQSEDLPTRTAPFEIGTAMSHVSEGRPREEQVQKKQSNANLVFFYWSSEKQRMRQGQLQTDAPERSAESDVGFAVPSAVTADNVWKPALSAPRCLKCGVPLDTRQKSIMCLNCKPPDRPSTKQGGVSSLDSGGFNINPLKKSYGAGRKLSSTFKSKEFHFFPSGPLFSLPVVDDEAEIRRIAEYRGLFPKRKQMFCCRYVDTEKAKSACPNPFEISLAVNDFPAFQIGLLLRNFAWSGLYLWTTTLVGRETSRDEWDVSRYPESYYWWEHMFMWMITWDYCILLLSARDQMR